MKNEIGKEIIPEKYAVIEDLANALIEEKTVDVIVVDKNFIKLGGNRFLVNTHMTVGELTDRLGIKPLSSLSPIRPLLSVILEHFGKMPEEDESFTVECLEITIEKVENSSVSGVIIHLLDADSGKEDAE